MLTTVLPALLALSAPQQPSSTAEMLPLQHICSEEQKQRSLPWGSLLRYAPDDLNADFVFGSEGGGVVSQDAIVDTLHGFMSTAIDEERLFLQTIDRNLLAVGETKLVEQVRDLIHEASGILARPVQVELAVWDAASDNAPATTLDAKGYAEFAANRAPLWRAVSTANAGQAVSLEHMTWSRYVRSIEIEVAQKKTMSRPATDRYGEGGCATVITSSRPPAFLAPFSPLLRLVPPPSPGSGGKVAAPPRARGGYEHRHPAARAARRG
ncbi:MAG TPA: hypothetical protein EYP98_09720 [Planctomycetes bacterium]|nr:hypothetical protein [Planctomycetota bacterium]